MNIIILDQSDFSYYNEYGWGSNFNNHEWIYQNHKYMHGYKEFIEFIG